MLIIIDIPAAGQIIYLTANPAILLAHNTWEVGQLRVMVLGPWAGKWCPSAFYFHLLKSGEPLVLYLYRMSKAGETISFRIGTLNTRGFRTKTKRKAVMRQAKTHSDLLLLQDTHMDGKLAEDVTKEWKGPWAFADKASNSGGVAMHLSNKCIFLVDDPNAFEDDNGSLLGRTVVAGPMTFYIISAYALCCSGSTQTCNLAFLKKLEKLIAEKQAKGLEVMAAGDLNCIRDSNLDASGGNPVVHKAQADWLDNLEHSLGMVDSFRFFRPDEKMYTWSPSGPNTKQLFRRLDYFLCSKQMLERATDAFFRSPTSWYSIHNREGKNWWPWALAP